MIATLTQQLSLDNLPVDWFDAALVAVLAFGVFRGRKNGLTKEILPMLQWIAVVVAAGLAYTFVARYYTSKCGLSKLWAAIFGYLTITMVTLFIFSGIKKALMPRLTGSNIFGSSEYYLGMPSGMIRYACILVFAMALLNARSYSFAEIAAKKAYNERWYGGGIYAGDYVPDLHSVQEAVFKKSFTGPIIKDYINPLLIQTGPGDANGKASGPKAPQPVIHMGK